MAVAKAKPLIPTAAKRRRVAANAPGTLELKREQLVGSLDLAHDVFYREEVFGGPSLYFHKRALAAAEEGEFDTFVESAYAVLAAWGMHRMGRGGSKMCEFDKFRDSLRPLWQVVLSLRQVAPADLNDNGWRDLRNLFCGICCMRSKTSLVGNSKVMAHALPNLVPPIDREYTLTFLYGRKDIANGIEGEWLRLEQMLREFFHPLLRSELFTSRTRSWMARMGEYEWDTSPLKIADNLVIGLSKHKRKSIV